MEQTKELTRQERIEAYQAEHDRRMGNVEEFNAQLTKLKLTVLVMDKEKKQEVEATLDTFPDMSAKGMVDKILQLPMQKRTQLNENITKLELAIENETRRAREALGKKKAIEAQIYDENADEQAKEVYRKYFEWLDGYKHVRDLYWNELVPTIQKAWEIDRKFPERGRKFGVNANAIISVMSHFRQGEFVSMEATVDKILYMADIEKVGKPLLEKHDSGGWPEVAEGPFFQESEFHK
jgi:hypothetical protein